MTEIKIKENTNWPDAVRLEMIERSVMFDYSREYQYGYYDGYQKLYKAYEAGIKERSLLIDALKNITAQFLKVDPLYSQDRNIIAEAKELLNNLKDK